MQNRITLWQWRNQRREFSTADLNGAVVEVDDPQLPEGVVGHETGGVVQQQELPQPGPHQPLPSITAQLTWAINTSKILDMRQVA